jgi:C4-dicarboxylate-specific signal transduction histidine kinase
MMGEMASSLAHELSQPLGAILRNAHVRARMLTHATTPVHTKLAATPLERLLNSSLEEVT